MVTPLNGSVMKGFAVLRLLSEDRPEITAATVSRELDMNAATAHRFLSTLEETGALVSLKRGRYILGYQLVEMGRLAMRTNPLAAIVKPAIEAASHDLNESVMAGRLLRAGVVCIATANSSRDVVVSIPVGRTLEPHASAHGKIWLAGMERASRARYLRDRDLKRFSDTTITDPDDFDAELEEVIRVGYALNLGEREPDLGAVAVPVMGPNGEILMSLSVFGMRSRFDDTLVRRAVARLNAVAADIAGLIRD